MTSEASQPAYRTATFCQSSESTLARVRPIGNRVRVERAEAGSAVVHLGYPERPTRDMKPTMLWDMSQVVAAATRYRRRPVKGAFGVGVEVVVCRSGCTERPGPAIELLSAKFADGTSKIEVCFEGLADTDENVAWFLNALVAAACSMVDGVSAEN